MAFQWYVLQSKPNKEEILWKRLRAKGYNVFFPRLLIHNKKTRSLKIRPFFPGYLFIHLNLAEVSISSFQWMPDTIGLICLAEKPAAVSDQFIQAIHIHLKEVAAMGERLLVGFDEPDQTLSHRNQKIDYRAFFDSHLSGQDRNNELYRLLQDGIATTVRTE